MQYHKLIPYFREICCDMEEFAMKIYVSAKAWREGDGSQARPFKHINDAAKIARPGDEVLVAPGIYREYVDPVNAGTEEAPITQSDICVALSQPRQTVNSSLKKLEREGLLALSGEGGRHGKPVSLTPQGLELAEKTVDRVIESEQKALLDLSPDEQKQLLDAMRRYNAMLNTRMHDILFAQEDIHE